MDNKERASWFAKYWGAEVQVEGLLKPRMFTGIDVQANGSFKLLLGQMEVWDEYAKLILTHISDISDELKDEIRKKHFPHSTKFKIDEFGINYWQIDFDGNQLHSIELEDLPKKIVDEFRELSIDIDNLISQGIAVRKEVGK